MKIHLITILTFLVIAVGSVSAQNGNIGTKIGINSYTIANDNGPGFDSKIGLHAGLLAHFHINRQFGIQPEVVYSMQGAKYDGTNFNLDYINVPVMLQYMFDNGLRVQAGPQVGFQVRAKGESGLGSMDIKNDFNTIDAGISFGASYVHTSSGFGIDARYNLGLTDISESSAVMSNSMGLQLGIFYLFNQN